MDGTYCVIKMLQTPFQFNTVAQSCPILWPHGLQRARPPCPSSPRVCPSSCSLYQWCHPAILYWRPLLPSIFPSTRDFSNETSVHIRWPKYWSFSFSIIPSSEYFGSISLLSEGLSGVLQHHNSKASIFWHLPSSQSSSRNHWEDHSLDYTNLCWQCLFVNTLSTFVIAFLPKSNRLLISWPQSPSAVILEPKRVNLSLFPPYPPLFAMK